MKGYFGIALLSLITRTCGAFDDTNITLGLIANQNDASVTSRNYTKQVDFDENHVNITLEWHYVDTSEVYYIYRSIQVFDKRGDVDVILLFDYDLNLLRFGSLLQTRNTVLIKWGEKRDKHSESDGSGPMYLDSKDLCDDSNDAIVDDMIRFSQYEDPYCLTDINASSTERTSEASNDSITLTAPTAISRIVELLKWSQVVIIHENATRALKLQLETYIETVNGSLKFDFHKPNVIHSGVTLRDALAKGNRQDIALFNERELDQVVDMLSKQGVLFVIFNIDLVDDLHDVILNVYKETLKQESFTKFVVLCRFNCARRVFRTANAFDTAVSRTLLKQFSQWLVAVFGHSGGVSRALKACASDLDNVVLIAIPEADGAGSESFDRTLDEILYSLQLQNIQGTANNGSIKDRLIDALINKAATWDILSSCRGYRIDTLLWEKSSVREFTSVGYVESGGHVVTFAELFPNTKYGYNQRSFNISTLEYKPFVMKEIVNGSTKYYGFCIDLLDELSNTLNFTYKLSEPADQKWGGYDNKDNLSFNGLIGQLQRQECDIVAAPIAIQADRSRVCDFAYPFFWEYSTVVLKKPDPNDRKWRTMIDPFKWQVLLCIGVSLPAVTVMVYMLEKYNPFYNDPKRAEERKKTGGLHYLHNAFWYMYGALLCQGGIHLPDSVAGRTFVSWWWIFCIIIVGTYSGNLIAFLTVTIEKLPFDSLEGLVEHKGTYKWGTLGGSSWENVLLTSPSPTFRKIGDGIREFNRSDPSVLEISAQQHINKVIRGGYAWIGDKTFIEHEMARECNNLATIKEEFLPLIYAFGFTKNSPHTTLFSSQMMKIHEGGLLHIWKRKWWPKGAFCKSDILTEAKPISLMDVQSAFYVCAVGIFLSGIAFCIECLCFYLRKGKRRKRSENVNFIRSTSRECVNHVNSVN